MYRYLVLLMTLAALSKLGIQLSELDDCPSRKCAAKIDRASRQILKVDWKPISVFPEEAERYK